MTTKQSILFVILFILILFSGIVLGRYVFGIKIVKTISIDSKMEECKKAGGQYNIYQSDYDWKKKYHIYCNMPQQKLFDFYIDANGNINNK